MAKPPVVEFYFSFVSLWSYIGSRRFQQLVKKTNAQVIYKSIDLICTFSISGGLPVKQRAPQRLAYQFVEMQRWRQIRNIPLVLQPNFYPADPSLAHRVLLAAIKDHGNDSPLVHEFAHKGLEAVWARELDIASAEVIVQLANEAGLDGKTLLGQAQAEGELKGKEKSLTEEAKGRQVFGAPFYFYQDEPFWGQDRLEMLEDVIECEREPLTFQSAQPA
ncbi:HCCA isomerase/glutathione S-transferase kappa [Penicillium malachiteum]|nr:HCCA isomerase/glutathione S-transferase kappa [Penicillium malachiteum]